MEVLKTKNGNFYFKISGVCFYTDKKFNLLKFADQSEYDRLKNENPQVVEITTEEKSKVYGIFQNPPQNLLSELEEKFLLKKSGTISNLLEKYEDFYVRKLEDIVDPKSAPFVFSSLRDYADGEVGKIGKFFLNPFYFHFKGQGWVVFGTIESFYNSSSHHHNNDDEENEKIVYIAPSFGEEDDIRYLKIRAYVKLISENPNSDLEAIKEAVVEMAEL